MEELPNGKSCASFYVRKFTSDLTTNSLTFNGIDDNEWNTNWSKIHWPDSGETTDSDKNEEYH